MVLMRAFARAFGVEPPKRATLEDFRAFTAACMEEALRDRAAAERYRAALGEEAFSLGTRVRRALHVGPGSALRITQRLYRGIGIELTGELPGELRFERCFFAERYTPGACWLMSAFDEGFMRGITGMPEGELVFSCRLTEGCPCCCARFS